MVARQIEVKIAQVCPRYYPDIGGVETQVQEISERLVKHGFEIEVICTDPTGLLPRHELINSVRVTRFKSFAPGDAYYFAPQIYFYLKKHTYDLIHAHSYHAFPALFATLVKNNCKLIFTPYYHGAGHTYIRNLLHKPYKLLGSKIFKKSDKVTCISEYELQKVMSDFGVPSVKIEKIPIGLSVEEFANLKHYKKNNSKKLLYVGRLEEYKGIQHIIKTLQYLKDFKMEIIGKGPYEHNLHKLAEELAVSNRIKWFKNITREELLQHYASTDVFLLLSKHESYGITVAEALASGVPCIVAMGSALDEFVDGETCIGLNYPIDTNTLANKIEFMSHKHPDMIKNTMDWNEVVKRLIKIYEEI
jgi:glycosyltransferase involved in cell wall biosynthesis